MVRIARPERKNPGLPRDSCTPHILVVVPVEADFRERDCRCCDSGILFLKQGEGFVFCWSFPQGVEDTEQGFCLNIPEEFLHNRCAQHFVHVKRLVRIRGGGFNTQLPTEGVQRTFQNYCSVQDVVHNRGERW